MCWCRHDGRLVPWFFNKNRHLCILGMLNWSDSQRARWIQLSARTSPAAPHPSCHFWPGDRPRWPPHTHPRWWPCQRCLSTSFPKPRLHHWKQERKEDWSPVRWNSFTHRSVSASPLFCAVSCRAADCPHGRLNCTTTGRQIFAQMSAYQLQHPRHDWDSVRKLCNNA